MKIRPSKIEYLKHHINFAEGCALACNYCYMETLYVRKHGEKSRPHEVAEIEFDQDYDELVNQIRNGFQPKGDIMLSTSHDPFMTMTSPAWKITQVILSILRQYPRFRGKVRTLTKSNVPLFKLFPLHTFKGVKFGVSVTTLKEYVKWMFEKRSAEVQHRLEMLQKVKARYGCYTWASCEPMLNGIDLYKFILETGVKEVWVGKLHYMGEREQYALSYEEIAEQVRVAKASFPKVVKVKDRTREVLERRGLL